MSLQQYLTDMVQQHIQTVVPGYTSLDVPPVILQPASNPIFGDYQTHFALQAAKQLQQSPRLLAEKIQAVLLAHQDDCLARVEVAGPGFINLTLSDTWLGQALEKMRWDERLGVPLCTQPKTVVIDYSSVNVAKMMHIGHLRSLILGDALVRLLSFAGHHVIRQNHLGDWGTQFGMLIEHILEKKLNTQKATLSDLESWYRQAKQRFDKETNFSKRARDRVVQLQQGDATAYEVWKAITQSSRHHFHKIYQQLGVLLAPEDDRGESHYNDDLNLIVCELLNTGLAQKDQGAVVIFTEAGSPSSSTPPFLIQKSDGGYLYATTDLAAARYRLKKLHSDWLIYVVDSRQKQHFNTLFNVLKRTHWAKKTVRFDHVDFGSILNKDRKPFKTRQGDTIALEDVLIEAQQRALEILRTKAKQPLHQSSDQQHKAAACIGLGALKYADLRNSRQRDYVFDWNQMLALDGNTVPYLQNAYVRIMSLLRKAGFDAISIPAAHMIPDHLKERCLTRRLLQFSEEIEHTITDLSPHYLCHYLYCLASDFHSFYEACPILNATKITKLRRLALCDTAARVLKQGLYLLGIEVVEQM